MCGRVHFGSACPRGGGTTGETAVHAELDTVPGRLPAGAWSLSAAAVARAPISTPSWWQAPAADYSGSATCAQEIRTRLRFSAPSAGRPTKRHGTAVCSTRVPRWERGRAEWLGWGRSGGAGLPGALRGAAPAEPRGRRSRKGSGSGRRRVLGERSMEGLLEGSGLLGERGYLRVPLAAVVRGCERRWAEAAGAAGPLRGAGARPGP
ncbi:unnamed protein product [Prorocentrum cordatum]|uniref:Uncharacterized protein n=1 Tax=Prorocentrum cordatum TaxID=2364126 RepID=A0ABN9VI42_9DINO|nr:unnamed protein product [Polarella glacialis]